MEMPLGSLDTAASLWSIFNVADMKIKLLSALVFMALAAQVQGQSLDKVLEVGDEAYESRDYYTAFRCYEKVLEYEDRFYERPKRLVQYQYGLAAQRFNYFGKADSVFTALVNASQTAGIKDSIYARAVYYQAQSALIQADSAQDYRDAMAAFERVKDELIEHISEDAETKKEFRINTENSIADCAFSLERGSWVEKDTVHRLEHIDINSPYSDYAPQLVGDTLFFSSLRYERNPRRQSTTYSRNLYARFVPNDSAGIDTLVSEMPASEIFNESARYTNHRAVTSNGKWMVFTSCESRGNEIMCALYKRQRLATGWGPPQLLSINGEKEDFTTKQPAFRQDCNGKEWLYFASDRKEGSVGKLDIWRCSFDPNSGRAGKVENLGDFVNTAWDEESPFFHSLTKRLFFSSNRPGGYGQHDLFYSQWKDSSWAEARNLGAPYNSGYNDMYYFTTGEGKQVYFSSDRHRSLRFVDSLDACCQDIYTLQRNTNRQLHLQLAQCEDKPSGVGNSRILVEDVTRCGQATVVFDSTFAGNWSDTLPVKLFHKYRITASTPGLANAVTRIVDFAEERFETEQLASESFELYPDFVELTVKPDIPKAEVENLDFLLSGTAVPKVVNANTGQTLAAQQGERVFRFAFDQPYDVAIEVDSNSNTITLFENPTTIDGRIYPVNLEGIYFPQQVCGKVCVSEVKVPLTTEMELSEQVYFHNDKPDRYNGITYITDQSLGNATEEYANLESDYLIPLIRELLEEKGLLSRIRQLGVEPYLREQDTEINLSQLNLGRGLNNDLTEMLSKLSLEDMLDALGVKVEEETDVNIDGPEEQRTEEIVASKDKITISDALLLTSRFFSRDIRNGPVALREMGLSLLTVMDKIEPGQSIEVAIQGVCSSHGSKAYNDMLALRRIQCITEFLQGIKIDTNGQEQLGDYMATWKLDSAQFKDYTQDEGRVVVDPKPSGAANEDTDRYMDFVSDSRYSIDAALERTVKVSVTITLQEPPSPAVFDLGNGCNQEAATENSISSKKTE